MLKAERPYSSRAMALLATAALVAGPVGAAFAAGAVNVAPAAPTNLTVLPSDRSADGTIVLTWKAPASGDISHYQVFRINGQGVPSATPITFRDRTMQNEVYFVDAIPTEGYFRYAVMAIDKTGKASLPSNWAGVTVDMPSNGTAITPDETSPLVPTNLQLGSAYTKNRAVSLSWDPQQTPDLWRFLVYRTDAAGKSEMVGYVKAPTREFAEALTADGLYTYTVLAQDQTGNVSAVSVGKQITVDTIAPKVTISQPTAGQTYPQSGSLQVRSTIEEAGAGYETASVEYFLNDRQLAGSTIDLAALNPGAHRLKLVVTDRAGNVGTAESVFLVGDATADARAPQTPGVSEFTKGRSVELTWKAPTSANPSNYVIYRSTAGQPEAVVKVLSATSLRYTDTVPADGLYSYRIAARYADGSEYAAQPIRTTADSVTPQVVIQQPVMGKTFSRSESLYVDLAVTENGTGYLESGVVLELDGTRLSSRDINLATLAVGSHTLKVTVADRAGNEGTALSLFYVNPVVQDPKAAQDLSTTAFSKSRNVALTWKAPITIGASQFVLYRSLGNGSAQPVAVLTPQTLQYVDTVPADATYGYYLVATYPDGSQATSVTASTIVDTVAPKVSITEPTAGRTYQASGLLQTSALVEENGSGYLAQDIKYYLDGAALANGLVDLTRLASGSHTVKVTVTDKAGNVGSATAQFTVGAVVTDPGAPQINSLSYYQKSRTVALSWKAPSTTGLTSYVVYRSAGNGLETVLTTLGLGTLSYKDKVPADGLYTYRVVAQYQNGQSYSSAAASTTVDTVAPAVVINTPEKGQVFTEGDLSVAVDVTTTDLISGVNEATIAYYLNGKKLSSEIIDLTNLADGEHQLKVVVEDRAGNQTTASSWFELQAGRTDDDDDDDDDDDHDDDNDRNKDLIEVLQKVQDEISNGHYNALMAFAQNNNLKAFRDHVNKFRGKFISEEAAEKLLKALGDNPGKHGEHGKSKGKGR